MKLSEIAERLSLDVLTPTSDLDVEVTGGYCGDLLSHVLASATSGDLWITIQHHANVVAVAQVAGLSAVVLADGKQPDDATRQRALDGGIALLGSNRSAFEISGCLYRLLADIR